MIELLFDQSAEDALAALKVDPLRQQLYERVNDVLDAIEDNPKDPSVRRRRFQSPPHWLVAVHGAGEDWIVMWELTKSGPFVHYIGEPVS